MLFTEFNTAVIDAEITKAISETASEAYLDIAEFLGDVSDDDIRSIIIDDFLTDFYLGSNMSTMALFEGINNGAKERKITLFEEMSNV